MLGTENTTGNRYSLCCLEHYSFHSWGALEYFLFAICQAICQASVALSVKEGISSLSVSMNIYEKVSGSLSNKVTLRSGLLLNSYFVVLK